jgi:Putative MetA-pathway of phenol degradation
MRQESTVRPSRHTCGEQSVTRLSRIFRFRIPGKTSIPDCACLLLAICFISGVCRAQDLTPRAYIITPIHSNAIVLSYAFENGDILLNPTLPVSNAKGQLHIPVFSYVHSFSFFGRSASIAAGLPYAVGHFEGQVNGADRKIYRSGLLDSGFRLSVNLKGGPAMDRREFVAWKQKKIVGASLTVTAPTSQYDPTVLVNTGTNRWAIKPEIGVSQRWGHWLLDTYGGVWFFTENPEFFSHNQEFPGTNTRSQNPLGAVEAHLSYDVKPRLWVSLDANYWYGGSTSLNGVKSPGTLQANSRYGVTASMPLQKHQSLKFSYSYGAIVRVGGNYHNLAVGWQYSWLGRPN